MTDLMTEYQALVASGSLKADAAQEAVLPEFERIRTALAEPIKRSLFRRAPEPPKGLYLWGGVGRGKSMLMDFFVSHVSAPRTPCPFPCVHAGNPRRHAHCPQKWGG